MKMETARAAAADWVQRHAAGEAWFQGAYLGGSAAALPLDADMPPTSDLDVFVVTAEAAPGRQPGKFLHRGVLLEVTLLPWARLASPEAVLADYHLAGGLRADRIIADPAGRLRRLQAEVSRGFAQEAWVRRRCAHARQVSLERLTGIDADAPWHDQVTTWLFGAGVATHVVLVAALRNPTVRLRYLRAREVLEEYGRADLHPRLLGLLGCADMTPTRADRHLDGLAQTFDAAAAARRTPYRFGADISPAARPVAIDGSRELIRAGRQGEAVFWLVATFARCHAILATDAPDAHRALAPAFDALLADLGIKSTADLLGRADAAVRFMPTVWEAAQAIIAANTGIEHDVPAAPEGRPKDR